MWVLLDEMCLDSQMGNKGALQWTGPYIVCHKLWDTIYQLSKLNCPMWGSVAANFLKIFYYCREHQTIRTVDPEEYTFHAVTTSSLSSHASVFIGTLNQPLLITQIFLVSIIVGVPILPDNWLLVDFATVTPYMFTLNSLHYHYHSTIAELNLMGYKAIQFISYTTSSSIANSHILENLLEDSNIHDLEAWVLTALPLCWVFLLIFCFCFYVFFTILFLFVKWWGHCFKFPIYCRSASWTFHNALLISTLNFYFMFFVYYFPF